MNLVAWWLSCEARPGATSVLLSQSCQSQHVSLAYKPDKIQLSWYNSCDPSIDVDLRSFQNIAPPIVADLGGDHVRNKVIWGEGRETEELVIIS